MSPKPQYVRKTNQPRNKRASYWKGYLKAARGLNEKGMLPEKMRAEVEKVFYKGVLERKEVEDGDQNND